MCFSRNSASLSALYVSEELKLLWRCAMKCVDATRGHGLDILSQDYEQSKATQALAQYHHLGNLDAKTIRSTDDFLFFAKFGAPSLQFVCNHVAIFTLLIEEASMRVDTGKAVTPDRKIDS